LIAAIIVVFVYHSGPTKVEVVVAGNGNDPCPEVQLLGRPAVEVVVRQLNRSVLSLGIAGEAADIYARSIAEYLTASLSACESQVAAARLREGLNGEVYRMARVTTGTVIPSLRPDPAILNSDVAVAEWFISFARPWAWIDLASIKMASRSWQQFSEEHADYIRRWRERRERAVATGPALYNSVFETAYIQEDQRDSVGLARVSITFGLRDGNYTVAPELHLVIYFTTEPAQAPRVVGIMLDGNHSGLWRDLAL
jgi:hypothetical protein